MDETNNETVVDRTEEFAAIFGHRLHGAPTEDNGWTVWPTRTSPMTLGKFVDRAKRAGFASAFCRAGRVGVRTSDLSLPSGGAR